MQLRKRFVSRTDAEWIRLEGERARLEGAPIYLAHEQRPGWSAPMPLYLWHCPDCDIPVVSHPQGYGRRIQCPHRPYDHRVFLPASTLLRDETIDPRSALPFLFLVAAILFCLVAVFWRACL